MKKQLEKRLQALEAEYQKGQQRLQELETEASNVRATLLRISGAVQVLREELGMEEQKAPPIETNGVV